MEHTIWSRVADLMRPAGMMLLSVLAVIVFLSCGGSGDEPGGEPTPQPNTAPIVFSGSLSESKSESHARTRATRGVPLQDYPDVAHGHKSFHVWSYKTKENSTLDEVMKNYTVNWASGSAGTTTSNTNGWEYVDQGGASTQTIKYWDFSALNYRFFGYSGGEVTPDYTDPTKVTLSFTAPAATTNPQSETSLSLPDCPLYSKLWYKTKTELPAQKNLPVTLQFIQPYVKVRFMYKASDNTSVFLMDNQSFAPTPSTNPEDPSKTIITGGTFTVTYPLSGSTEESWSVTGGTTTLPNGFEQDYYEDDDDPTTPADPNAQRWYIVLPATDQGSYTLSVELNGDPKSVVVPAQYMKWLPGYQYTYVFKITEAGSLALDGVQSGFAPWDTTEGSWSVFNW